MFGHFKYMQVLNRQVYILWKPRSVVFYLSITCMNKFNHFVVETLRVWHLSFQFESNPPSHHRDNHMHYQSLSKFFVFFLFLKSIANDSCVL